MRALLYGVPIYLVSLPAFAQTLNRGPYLQQGTDRSVVIRWRTDAAAVGRVRYGASPGILDSFVDAPAAATDHEVRLDGLSAGTTYYYAVGTTAGAVLAGGDPQHFFVTSPPPGAVKPTRMWVLGDAGTKGSSQRAVRDAYTAFTGTRHTDLWLMLGDNAYSSGTDAEYQLAVFAMYPEMLRKSVLWPALGNHDAVSADSASQSGVYYDLFTLPRNGEAGGAASGTEAYYSFDYGNVHFICLDSQESSRSPAGPMATWLRADLASTEADWIVAFWHHPPYSKGSHNSDRESNLVEMRTNFLPILEEGGVDLVLSGHSHSYERSFLLDGHYGTSETLSPAMIKDGGSGREDGTGAYRKSAGTAPREGAVYVVAGSSGQAGGGSLNHPAMFVSLDHLGSLVIDVDGYRMDVRFLRETGAVDDSFTLLKGASAPVPAAPPAPPPPAPSEPPPSPEPAPSVGGGSGGRCGATGAEALPLLLLLLLRRVKKQTV